MRRATALSLVISMGAIGAFALFAELPMTVFKGKGEKAATLPAKDQDRAPNAQFATPIVPPAKVRSAALPLGAIAKTEASGFPSPERAIWSYNGSALKLE